jgi:hypothetical protein
MRAAALAWVGLAFLSMPGRTLAQPAAPKATLADVAFIAGHWRGTVGTGLSEEIWAPPAGDNMVGMWRLVMGDQVQLFEFLTIVQDADGPVFRLRHFDRRGVGREEKDRPIELKLVSWKAGEAVFEGRDYGDTGALRLEYRRPTDASLSVTLVKPGAKPQEFTFTLAAPMR